MKNTRLNTSFLPEYITVHGQVVDTLGEPVMANVYIADTARGVLADFDGNFILTDVHFSDTIVVSFQGNEVRVPATEASSTIVMEVESLDEVVINAPSNSKAGWIATGIGILVIAGIYALSKKNNPIYVEL